MDRINTIDLPSVSSDVVYTYNAQAMRTNTQRPNSTSTNYDYDPAMRMDEISENLSGSAGDNTFLYTFNPANQIKTLSVSNQTYAVDHTAQGRPGVYQTNGLNQYTQANGGTLDYDTVGNMTLDEDEDAIYEYSIENQLTKAIKGAAITELGYDATGKLLNIGNTYFLYDGEAVIAERNQQNCYPCGRTMTTRYVHSVGIDDPIVQYNGSGTSSYAI